MGTRLRCWRGERGWIGTRSVVLLDGREVDGIDGNTVAALTGRSELDRDTVHGAVGQEKGVWDGWEHSGAAGGETRAG